MITNTIELCTNVPLISTDKQVNTVGNSNNKFAHGMQWFEAPKLTKNVGYFTQRSRLLFFP